LRLGDRRAQSVVHLELEGLDNMEDGLIPQRRGAIEAAPGHQHAAGRTGIVAAVAQQEGVAQRRLVLAAARDPRSGGRGLQRQAAAPHPGEGHVCAHSAIEHGERGAGPKRGLVAVCDRRIDAGPARHWRQRKCLCERLLRGASHGEA